MTFDVRLAIAADRTLVPGLEMGAFSYWPTMDDGVARRRHVLNRARLHEILTSREPSVIAVTPFDVGGLSITQPKVSPKKPDESPLFQLFPEMRGSYRLERTIDIYPSGVEIPLLIFVRIDPPQ